MNSDQSMDTKLRLEKVLLANMRRAVDELQKLLDSVNHDWVYEDGLYRFYYQSYKVYRLQEKTLAMVAGLTRLAPEGREFSEYFQEIIRTGTGRTFTFEVNQRWVQETAPLTQAFLHARYFLEMAVKYASLESPPQPMPSGWAAMLCLFDLR